MIKYICRFACLVLLLPNILFAQSANIIGQPTGTPLSYVAGAQAYTTASIFNTPVTATFTGSTSGTTLTVAGTVLGLPITVGQTLYATGSQTFSGGTTITGSATTNPTGCSPNCTGIGGAGTYAISASQTISSVIMNANTNTYTTLAWPASTGFNYFSGNPVAMDFPGPGAPSVTLTGPSSWGWPACSPCTLQMTAGFTGAPGSDCKAIVINGSTMWSFECLTRDDDTHAHYGSYAKSDIVTGTGFGTLTPSFLGAGTTAISMSDYAGAINSSDLQNGVIPHKLGYVVLSALCSPGFIAPAINSDCSSGSGIVQEGAILALPPNIGICNSSNLGVGCIAGLDPVGVILFKAIQTYGVIVNDNGGVTGLQFDAALLSQSQQGSIITFMRTVGPLMRKVN